VRALTKRPTPEILAREGADWLRDFLADPTSASARYRYRHADIKRVLRDETAWKCVYCESKIGHSSPGDVEHKIPSGKVPALHFAWENLTVACTECNRRKSDYHDDTLPFLDPYADPVENDVVHAGPFVSWRSGAQRAELSIRLLEMHGMQRPQLVQQKMDVLERARSLADLIAVDAGTLRDLRLDELKRMQAPTSEYSACVRAFVAVVLPLALAA
jgi:hypothetical protein